MDVLQVHKNQEFDEVFFTHDRKEHTIDGYSSLSRMEVSYQTDGEVATISQPWKLLTTCMVQNTSSPFSYLHNLLWNTHVLG